MEDEDAQVNHLEEGGQVEIVDADEGRGGARYENAGLVDGVVGWVEGTEVLEGCFFQGEEECWGNALIYRVFGDVDQEKGEHAT